MPWLGQGQGPVNDTGAEELRIDNQLQLFSSLSNLPYFT